MKLRPQKESTFGIALINWPLSGKSLERFLQNWRGRGNTRSAVLNFTVIDTEIWLKVPKSLKSLKLNF